MCGTSVAVKADTYKAHAHARLSRNPLTSSLLAVTRRYTKHVTPCSAGHRYRAYLRPMPSTVIVLGIYLHGSETTGKISQRSLA